MDLKPRRRFRLVLGAICVAAAVALGISVLSYRNDSRAETTTRANRTSPEVVGATTLDAKLLKVRRARPIELLRSALPF